MTIFSKLCRILRYFAYLTPVVLFLVFLSTHPVFAEEATDSVSTPDSAVVTDSPILSSLGEHFNLACTRISGELSWLTCPLVSIFANSLSGLYAQMIFSFNQNSKFVSMRISGESSGVFRTWLYFLLIADLTLVAFTFVLLALKLAHRDSEEFSINRLSPRLLATAILINFSFFICLIFVDATNLAGSTLKNLFDLFASAIANAYGQVSPNYGELFPADDPSALLSFSFVLLVNTFSYLFMWALLAAREAFVTVLIFSTPLVFTIILSPYWKKSIAFWGKLFAFALFCFPLAACLIGLGDLLSTVVLTSFGAANGFAVALISAFVGVLPYFLFIPLAIPLYRNIRRISLVIENPSAFTRNFIKLDAEDNDLVIDQNAVALIESGRKARTSSLLARASETIKSRVDQKNQAGSNLADLFTATASKQAPINKVDFDTTSTDADYLERPIPWRELVAKTSSAAYHLRFARRRLQEDRRRAEEEEIVLLAKSDEFNLGTDFAKMLDALADLANQLGSAQADEFVPVSEQPEETSPDPEALLAAESERVLSSESIRFGALARLLAMSDSGGTLLNDLVYNQEKLSPLGLLFLNRYRLANSDLAVAMQKTGAVTSAFLNDLETLLKPQLSTQTTSLLLPSLAEIGQTYTNSVLESPLEIVAQSASELARFATYLSADKISALLSSEYFSYILSDPDKWGIIEALPAYQALSETQRAEARQKTAAALNDVRAAVEAKQKAERLAEARAERESYLRELETEARENPEGPEKILVEGREFMVFRVPFDDDAFHESSYNPHNWVLSPSGEPVYSEGKLHWYGVEAKLEED